MTDYPSWLQTQTTSSFLPIMAQTQTRKSPIIIIVAPNPPPHHRYFTAAAETARGQRDDLIWRKAEARFTAEVSDGGPQRTKAIARV